jgi:hypothetical protein
MVVMIDVWRTAGLKTPGVIAGFGRTIGVLVVVVVVVVVVIVEEFVLVVLGGGADDAERQ